MKGAWMGFLGSLVVASATEESWLDGFNPPLVPVTGAQVDAEAKEDPHWAPWRTAATPSGTLLLGTFDSEETLTFRRDHLPPHRAVLFKIEVAILSHWDGTWESYGPDYWQATVKEGPTLLKTTFSNYRNPRQHFPDDVGGGAYPARTGASRSGDLGWFLVLPDGRRWEDLDATYDLWLAMDHHADDWQITFHGEFHDDPDPPELRGEAWGVRRWAMWVVPEDAVPRGPWVRQAAESLCRTEGEAPDPRAIAQLVTAGSASLKALDRALARKGFHALSRPKAPGDDPLIPILRDLGKDDYPSRKAAFEELLELLPSQIHEVRAALEETDNPEVRRGIVAALNLHYETVEALTEPDLEGQGAQVVLQRLRKVLTLMGGEEAQRWLKALDDLKP